jgi:hypothetical protein
MLCFVSIGIMMGAQASCLYVAGLSMQGETWIEV